MKLSKEEVQQFKDLPKQHGDVIRLMRACELKAYPHFCDILAGKAGTKISVIGKIKKFITNRKKEINDITLDAE